MWRRRLQWRGNSSSNSDGHISLSQLFTYHDQYKPDINLYAYGDRHWELQ